MQHSESENVRDKNFTESSANLAAAVDDGFAKDKQTVEMEFAQTQYSPRGVVLLYFRGEPAAEVDRHFSRTFAELCCLPGSSSPENSLEDSHFQGRTCVPIPMSQRNLPPSFWNPSHKNKSQHPRTGSSHHGNSVNIFQQKHNMMTHYNSNYQPTVRYDNFNRHTESNFVHTRTIPVSYAQLPTGTIKSDSSGPQIRVQPFHAFLHSLPHESASQNSDLEPNSLRFDPSYNSLLVQPDVKPHLPHIPGEPSRTRTDARNKNPVGFPAESSMRKEEKLRSTSTKIYAFELSAQDEFKNDLEY
ncbi:uncharacterized protein [Pocillopora verrucosa]|uniref:uncharacterized protein n=1 Tax=Pocillopora verrucosa TaxID=203993 RepID=UPI00333EACCC